MLVIVSPDAATAESLRTAVGKPAEVTTSIEATRRFLSEHDDVDVVLVGPAIETEPALELARVMRVSRPELGVVLVRRRVDTSVLGDALRAGVREVVSERDLSSVATATARALDVAHAIRVQTDHGAGAEYDGVEGRMITVFSSKGGCGKTTLATNLAATLAAGGRREVCLVDLDLAFGDVAITLQLFPAHTIADAVSMGESLDETGLHSLLTPHSPGLTTLLAPVEPGAADIPVSIVATALRLLKQQFQYVVVDTPPAFTDHVLAAFDESTIIALIATLDVPALKNLKLTLETLDLLNYPRDQWRVVLNRADSKVGLTPAEAEKTLRVPISCEIPSSRAVPAAINRGVPIVTDEPNHAASVAIRRFVEREILGNGNGGHHDKTQIPEPLRSDRRSLLRRKAKHA
jgi:pilus assembly protein CpaE